MWKLHGEAGLRVREPSRVTLRRRTGSVEDGTYSRNLPQQAKAYLLRPPHCRRGADLADPAQAGSALSQGRQAARGGDGPCADPLEASEARSATGAKVREGLKPNGRDGKGGTVRGRKPGGAPRRHAQAVPDFQG